MINETIRREVISYLNGNITQFKDFLKKCSKKDIIECIFILHHESGDDYNVVLNKIGTYLK